MENEGRGDRSCGDAAAIAYSTLYFHHGYLCFTLALDIKHWAFKKGFWKINSYYYRGDKKYYV
jgi:hypothetical protein